jgi:hypothetical protein
MADLAVHFSTLHFHSFNFPLKVGLVSTLVSALISLCDCVFSQTACFKIFFVQKSLGTSALIIEA